MINNKEKIISTQYFKEYMHYKIIKQVKYEYSCIYIIHLSRIKKKWNTNVKYLLLAIYQDHYKEIMQ